MTANGSEILVNLEKRYPDLTRTKIVELSLIQTINWDATLSDEELCEITMILETLSEGAQALEAVSSDNPKAEEMANHLRKAIIFLHRIVTGSNRFRNLTTGNSIR
jgi:hypothetical protein